MHSIADAHNLAAEEQELIRAAAANQGVLEVVKRVETQRPAVIAGRKTFFDRQNPAVAEKYLAHVANLKALDLVREAANKHAYELTNFGWQLSRGLGRATQT